MTPDTFVRFISWPLGIALLFWDLGYGFTLYPKGIGVSPAMGEGGLAIQALTMIHCSLFCRRQHHCQGISYSNSSKTCRAYDFDLTSMNDTLQDDPTFETFWADDLDEFKRYRSKAYHVNTTSTTFENAKKYCDTKFNTSLVLPMNSDEQSIVLSLLPEDATTWLNVYLPENPSSDQDYNNAKTDQKLTYERFGTTSANGDKCANLDEDYSTWYSSRCDANHIIVCELTV